MERPGIDRDDDPAPQRAAARRIPTALAILLGLLTGVGLAILGAQLLDDDAPESSGGAVPRTLDEGVDSPEDLLGDLPTPAGARAESPRDAMTGFLDAEAAGDYEVSFGYLSEPDRRAFGSAAGWVAGHAGVLAPVVSYDLGDATEDGDRAAVTSDMAFEPGLDQVAGLSPARASVTWTLERGSDGGWGVALEASAIEPIYPPDEGAARAAQAWVEARRACQTPANERSGLVGSPALADGLCDAPGDFDLADPARLGETEAGPIITSFGPEAAGAARIVRIGGSVELAAVLVPIGDEWLVIGVLP